MFLSIFKGASPNAHSHNKQSNPTPNRISVPLVEKSEYAVTSLKLNEMPKTN